MSKQSEAKKAQNYQDKPLSRRCRECKFLKVKEVPVKWDANYVNEHLFCGVGGFAVKANSICDRFERS